MLWHSASVLTWNWLVLTQLGAASTQRSVSSLFASRCPKRLLCTLQGAVYLNEQQRMNHIFIQGHLLNRAWKHRNKSETNSKRLGPTQKHQRRLSFRNRFQPKTTLKLGVYWKVCWLANYCWWKKSGQPMVIGQGSWMTIWSKRWLVCWAEKYQNFPAMWVCVSLS